MSQYLREYKCLPNPFIYEDFVFINSSQTAHRICDRDMVFNKSEINRNYFCIKDCEEVYYSTRFENPIVLNSTSESTPENVQVTNPVPQLRRSQRTHNKPDWYKNSHMLVMLVLFYLFASVSCTFNKVSPVIWRKSEQPLIKGINRVIANIQFESPCRVSDDEYFN